MREIMQEGKNWHVRSTGKHSSVLECKDGVFDNVSANPIEGANKTYECPRGHNFKTDTPIVIAVDNDPDYNSGPICSYCYVDWFRVNLNAKEGNGP